MNPPGNTSNPDPEVELQEINPVGGGGGGGNGGAAAASSSNATPNFDRARRQEITEDAEVNEVVVSGGAAAAGYSNATPNFDRARRQEITEDAEVNEEVVVRIRELLQRCRDVVEVRNGVANIIVVSQNGAPVRLVMPTPDDNKFSPREMSQLALTFFTQLAPVFVATVLNRLQPSCSCSPSPSSPSPSPSHADPSDSDYWIAVAVIITSLIGFVVSLISTSRLRRTTVSSPLAKLGFAAVASVAIICTGVGLPSSLAAKIAVSAAACLPALFAIANS